MQKIILISISILLILGLIVLAVLAYSGLFSKIEVSEQNFEEITFVYVEHTGSYYKVGPDMNLVYETLKNLELETTRGIGLYFDDPAQVKAENLRSEVGSIIEKKDLEKLTEIKEAEKFKQAGLKIKTLPAQKALMAEFPIKTPLSYMLAPMRVYPAFGKYLEQAGLAAPDTGIEIYDMNQKKTLYLMTLETI